MLWALFIFFDLAAEPVDIYHNGVVIDGDGVAPYLLVDHVLGKHLLGVLHKEQEERAFLGGKKKLLTIFIKTHG